MLMKDRMGREDVYKRQAYDSVVVFKFFAMAQGKYVISGSDRDLIPIGKFIIQSTPHVKVSGLVGCGCTHSSCSFLSGTISANGGYRYAQWFCPHELGKCCYTCLLYTSGA